MENKEEQKRNTATCHYNNNYCIGIIQYTDYITVNVTSFSNLATGKLSYI